MAASMKMTVFWDVALCSLIEIYHFSEVLTSSFIGAMMKAVSTSETLVNFYQIAWCNIPEDSHLHSGVII
jgi:hypothetical protein